MQLKKDADSGSAEAQYKIAKIYEHCEPKLYEYYIDLSYRQNYWEAIIEKAQDYDLGNIFSLHPYEDALKYYKLAADQEIQFAITMIGYFYQYGLGCEKSIEQAIEYYKKAAANDHPIAASLLAHCYEIGIGGSSHRKKLFILSNLCK